MAETDDIIYEPRQWTPVVEIIDNLAHALRSDYGLALRELNNAVFQKRAVRLLREPNAYFGVMPRPKTELASDRFLSDYRFVLRPGGRLDLDFRGPPDRWNPCNIMYFDNYLSRCDVDAYWRDLWSAPEEQAPDNPIDEKPTLPPLSLARDAEVEAYLATLPPLSEPDAWAAAKEHFGASISRERFRSFNRPKAPRGKPRTGNNTP